MTEDQIAKVKAFVTPRGLELLSQVHLLGRTLAELSVELEVSQAALAYRLDRTYKQLQECGVDLKQEFGIETP